MGHLSRRADSAAHQELFHIYISTNIRPCKTSGGCPLDYLFSRVPQSKFILSLEQRLRAGGLGGKFMKLSCFCAPEAAVDTVWEKGSEILLKAQHANAFPHLPALNRGDVGLRPCPRNAGEMRGRGISAHSKLQKCRMCSCASTWLAAGRTRGFYCLTQGRSVLR